MGAGLPRKRSRGSGAPPACGAGDFSAAVMERDVLGAVLQWLELKRMPRWRINSGALKTRRGNLVRFGARGMSDIHAIGPGGISIWIECKRPKGGALSADQREFLDCVNRNGGIGIIVSSIESLELQRGWRRRRRARACPPPPAAKRGGENAAKKHQQRRCRFFEQAGIRKQTDAQQDALQADAACLPKARRRNDAKRA